MQQLSNHAVLLTEQTNKTYVAVSRKVLRFFYIGRKGIKLSCSIVSIKLGLIKLKLAFRKPEEIKLSARRKKGKRYRFDVKIFALFRHRAKELQREIDSQKYKSPPSHQNVEYFKRLLPIEMQAVLSCIWHRLFRAAWEIRGLVTATLHTARLFVNSWIELSRKSPCYRISILPDVKVARKRAINFCLDSISISISLSKYYFFNSRLNLQLFMWTLHIYVR